MTSCYSIALDRLPGVRLEQEAVIGVKYGQWGREKYGNSRVQVDPAVEVSLCPVGNVATLQR